MCSQALGVKREATECDLEFVGFVAISSPVKVDSKHNIKCILQASHHVSKFWALLLMWPLALWKWSPVLWVWSPQVVMITGDNPLTACHVAKELKITKKQLLILTRMDNTGMYATE